MTMAASDERRESAIQKLIARFGEFKKVIRMRTGVAYKVPTRDILEKGIREQDLDRYPLWTLNFRSDNHDRHLENPGTSEAGRQ